MVTDLYGLKRRAETNAIPVLGDFFPAALLTRPLEADIQSFPSSADWSKNH